MNQKTEQSTLAEGVMPKIELILSRLAILEDKMDGIEKHMRNVDEKSTLTSFRHR